MDIILLLLWLVYFLVVDDNLGYFSYIGPFLMLVDSVVRSFLYQSQLQLVTLRLN